MNIDKAAQATRKYWSAPHWEYQDTYFAAHDGYDPENVGELYGSCAEANAACDRMNLLAVLEAIREPSENVARACRETTDVESSYYEHNPYDRWRAMIDALIAEVPRQPR